jgi:hypothetical protein
MIARDLFHVGKSGVRPTQKAKWWKVNRLLLLSIFYMIVYEVKHVGMLFLMIFAAEGGRFFFENKVYLVW